MNHQLPAMARKLSEIVAEYNEKVAAVDHAVKDFERAGSALKIASTIGGTWGDVSIDTGHVYDSILKTSLLKSAWRHVYKGLNIEAVAPASDKEDFERAMANPPDFTIDNIRATFGDYIKDPLSNILRGLAEVFSGLDPAYKSHEKVKIGVDGLPKRVILSNVGGYSSWGRDRLRDILNALAAYQGIPLIEYAELEAILKDGDALRDTWEHDGYDGKKREFPARGVWLKRFQNGNGHLFFSQKSLADINRALAEYYGDVLPDCHEAKPEKKRESTDVSKDLQYYPTPQAVVDRVLDDTDFEGLKVLEPSCGCGRFLDGLRARKAKAFGVEFDPSRADECRRKGHAVMVANFLELTPTADYDRVVMNPPFYGKHYEKHVRHAMKFLKPGGVLIAVLPATARYDHGLFDDMPRHAWTDLPVGSFRESGTGVNTTVLKVRV